MKKKKIRNILDSHLVSCIKGVEQADLNNQARMVDQYKHDAFITLTIAKLLDVIDEHDYNICHETINMMCVGKFDW